MAQKVCGTAHQSGVHYVWCREIGERGRPHYHLAIMLNKDAYSSLGMFELGRNNNYNRVQEAWASALVLPVASASGRAHISENPVYEIHRDDPAARADFLYRTSYICKVAIKVFGDGLHCFGASRA